MVSAEDFDPNKNFKVSPWMVYSDGKVSLYKSRGPALNRFMHAYGPVKLCQLAGGQWVTHAYKPTNRLDFGQRACDVCADRPLAAAQQYKGDSEYAHGHWAWKRENSKITEPPELLFVCYTCLQRIS